MVEIQVAKGFCAVVLLAFAWFVISSSSCSLSLILGLCLFCLLASVSRIASGGEFRAFGTHPRADPVLATGGLWRVESGPLYQPSHAARCPHALLCAPGQMSLSVSVCLSLCLSVCLSLSLKALLCFQCLVCTDPVEEASLKANFRCLVYNFGLYYLRFT